MAKGSGAGFARQVEAAALSEVHGPSGGTLDDLGQSGDKRLRSVPRSSFSTTFCEQTEQRAYASL